MQAQPIFLFIGPTASGKSQAALELAERVGGVIINADSQQVYRELRILTARPSSEEEARAPHRLYGFLSGEQACSAGIWLRHAKMEIDWALGEGKPPIVVGGTGLYIKALMQGIADIPDIPLELRNQAQSDYDEMGEAAFRERLRAVDPVVEQRIMPNDLQRLVRGWSVWLGTGKALSWWQAQPVAAPYAPEQFDIRKFELPREELYARCDARLVQMVEKGVLEEVQALGTTIPPALQKIIGVPELSATLRGEIPLDDAIAQAQQATRNYAKRQMTWFRNQILN